MTIDECIYYETSIDRSGCERSYTKCEHEQIASWLKELKAYQQLDLEITQHFTKEQSAWIKKYCIEKNKEFYKQGVDDLKNELLEICVGYNSTYDSQIIYVAEQLKAGGKNDD